MSPLILVGILISISSTLADVKHVLEGSAHPPNAISPEAVNHLANNNGQFWWMDSNSPLKAAYDYYKKCNTKGNCLPSANPNAPPPQPFRPQENLNVDFDKKPEIKIDVNKNPFFNGNFKPTGGNANYNNGGSKIDINKNPFLSGSVVTTGNGTPVIKDENGFLGVQPAQPFGKKPFGTSHPSDEKTTTHPVDAHKKKPGFATQHPLQNTKNSPLDLLNVTVECKGEGFMCVEKSLCLNGVINTDGEGLLQIRSDVRYCREDTEICCRLNNLNEITAGKSSVPESTIKFAGGAGFSPGLIHVQPLNVQPDIIFAGEHGHHSTASTSKAIRDTSLTPNSVFPSTVDYSDTKFSSDVRFASTFQGPAYLPPVGPTTPQPRPFETRQPSINQQYVPSRPSTPSYVQPSITTPRPFPSTLRPAPAITFAPAPSTPYRPAPSTTFRPAPSTTFRPAPTPFRPAPTTTFRPAPSVTYRPAPSTTFRPAPSASREYLPPRPSTPRPTTSVTQYVPPQKPYQPSVTPQQPYQPSVTPQKPYQPSIPYQPSTPQQPYQPSVTPQRPFPPSVTPQRPYQPSVTPQKPYQPSVTPQQPYQPSVTPQQPYQPSVTPQQPYRPSVTPQKPYQPSVTPQQPYQPTFTPQKPTLRPYQPPQTTPRPYQPPQTTPKPYQPSPTTPRPYRPPQQPYQPSTPRPTTSREYLPPRPSSPTPQPFVPQQTYPTPARPSPSPYYPQPQPTPQYPSPSSPQPRPTSPPFRPSYPSPAPIQPRPTPPPYQPSYPSPAPIQPRPTPAPYKPSYPSPAPIQPRPTPAPYKPSYPSPAPIQPRPTPAPYKPSYPSPQPTQPRPTPPPFRPTPSIPQFPSSPQPRPSITNGYQYPTPSSPRPNPFIPQQSTPLVPGPSFTNPSYVSGSTQYTQPSTTSRPYQPTTSAPSPVGGYEYPKPTPTFGYPSTTPRQDFGNSNVNNQFVRPPKRPSENPDQSGEAANIDGAFIRPTTARTQYQGEQNTAPPSGCAAALKCVQEIYCTAEGVISPVPVVLTKEQELSRVPTTVCQDTEAGIIGKCCRDPNYKDPWPSANLVNGVDDGQYKEDDSISQYQPDLQRKVRSDKGAPTQGFSGNQNTNVQPAPQPTCGERRSDTKPQGPGPIDANFAEIPWQAMILRDSNRSLLCGGVIIKRNAVLTAAHCVDGIETNDILIKGGEWKLGVEEEPLPFQVISVAARIRHPQYQRDSLTNDLALLILEEKLKLSKNVGPLCLPPPNQIPTQNCIATGWGKRILQLHAKGAIMHAVDVKIMDNQQCQETLNSTFQHAAPYYSPNTLCGYSNIDQCRVDYGSALACSVGNNYVLSGIYAWDTGCKQEGQIGGYIAPDVEWIESIVSKPLSELRKLDQRI